MNHRLSHDEAYVLCKRYCISHITTSELVEELCKREGVTVEDYADFKHIVVRE